MIKPSSSEFHWRNKAFLLRFQISKKIENSNEAGSSVYVKNFKYCGISLVSISQNVSKIYSNYDCNNIKVLKI